MENFVYHSPVKIIFGRNVLDRLGDELSQLGSRVLFVYGRKAIKAIGLYDRIKNSLNDSGIDFIEFGEIRPNPLLSDVHRGIDAAAQAGCHSVLAVGGGSVIDTAKAVAAGVGVNHDVWKFFNGRKSVSKMLPLLTVPTIAGSGSEVNHGMVLTNDDLQLKFGFAHRKLYPETCLADPAITFSVPEGLTACGCVDVLCHCLEPYLTTEATGISLQRGFLENIAKTVMESSSGCIKDPESYDHRAAMLWSSMLATSSLASAGLGKLYFSLHALEHGISALHDVSHGIGLSALLPGWLTYHRNIYAERIAAFGEQLFNLQGSSTEKKVEATIAELKQFLLSIGCPTSLSAIKLSAADLGRIAAHTLEQSRIWRLPGLDEKKVADILFCCF